MTGYFFAASKVRRPEDDAPDVGLAVASLGDEDFRRFPAGLLQLGDVAGLELRDERAVRAAPQLRHGGQVDARIRVDVVRASVENFTTWFASAVRERRQARAVEVDAVVVDEVRVLARIHAARAEPDLALLLVDAHDVPDHPVALGDLVLHRAGRAIVQIEVVPAVALRHPDDFLAVGDIEAVALARVRRRRSWALRRSPRAPCRWPRRPR